MLHMERVQYVSMRSFHLRRLSLRSTTLSSMFNAGRMARFTMDAVLHQPVPVETSIPWKRRVRFRHRSTPHTEGTLLAKEKPGLLEAQELVFAMLVNAGRGRLRFAHHERELLSKHRHQLQRVRDQ